MKKVVKIGGYVLLLCGFIMLGVSTYFNTTGINEWWNENVAQWLGGASLAVVATTIISFTINFASKSNLDLGLKSLNLDSKNFTDNTRAITDKFVKREELDIERDILLQNIIEENTKNNQLINELMVKVDILLNHQIEIANHDEKMIRDGTAKKIVLQAKGDKVNEK